jgi:hypothetical protein
MFRHSVDEGCSSDGRRTPGRRDVIAQRIDEADSILAPIIRAFRKQGMSTCWPCSETCVPFVYGTSLMTERGGRE